MSIFEIIFANFWTWAGTVVLVATLLDGLANVIAAMRAINGAESGRTGR